MKQMVNRLIELAMSFGKKQAEERVYALSFQIFYHMIKIVLIGNPEYQQHWKSELSSWLGQLANLRVKSNNLPLSRKFYLATLFTNHVEDDLDWVAVQSEYLALEFPKTPIRKDITSVQASKKILTFLNKYYDMVEHYKGRVPMIVVRTFVHQNL